MFEFIIGLACIAFFGCGAIVLLRKKNYLYSGSCLIFVFIGIILLLPESNTEKNEAEITNSPKPVVTNTPPVKTQAAAPTVTLKNDSKFDLEAKQLLNTVQNIVDTDFTFKTSIKQIELNEHIGTDESGDFIALISLSYDQLHSEETTKKWIEEYTSHLAALLGEQEKNITSLVIFWETPRFKENWNTAKYTLVKKDDGIFYFESKTFDKSVFN
ncbi:hypothetical protein [Solibacillus sp.]|uniref:hypothetical protein n=1 Tax=Solibacillus sp. TaxID=1909654 RepID=UPI0033157DA0